MELSNSLPPASSSSHAVSAERDVETLRYKTMSFELDLKDNRGRSVSVSYQTQQLDYTRSYDRFGSVSSIGGTPDPMSGFFKQISSMASKNISEQGMALIEHQQEKLNIKMSELTIEGDVSLLKDYLSSTSTANRIMNFVDRIGAAVDKADPLNNSGFKDFMSEISAGIAEGFAQAKHILGGLPDVSIETQDLMQLLLAQYTKDPSTMPKAEDYLDEVRSARTAENASDNA